MYLEMKSNAELCLGGMCLLTWTRFANRYSIGGIEQHITDLQQCIITCQLRSDCIAVDFDTTSNPPCWIHTDPNDLVGENVYDTSGDAVAQYVINRTCVTLPTTGQCYFKMFTLSPSEQLSVNL